jgi:hypothetical protein
LIAQLQSTIDVLGRHPKGRRHIPLRMVPPHEHHCMAKAKPDTVAKPMSL